MRLEVPMRAGLWLVLLLTLSPIGSADETVSVRSLLSQMTDLEYLTRKPSPPFKTAQTSSYDRASKSADQPDWFANGDSGHFLRMETVEGRNEWVLADLKGPGAVVRFWSANPNGTVRFYFDGESRPRIECPLADLLGGRLDHLGDPFAYVSSSGWNLYFPVPYAQSLKITVDEGGRGIYYHVGYRTYVEPIKVKTFSWDQLETLKTEIVKTGKVLLNPDRRRLPEGLKTHALSAVVTRNRPFALSIGGKPSAIFELKVKLENQSAPEFAKWEDPAQWHQLLRRTTLRAFFDGEKTVETPLGDFFGSAPGINPFKTFPFEMREDGTMVCRLVMPFSRSCRLEFSTQSPVPVKLSALVKVGAYNWTEDSYHFKAQWLADRLSTRPMKDMTFLNVEGEGVFVGGNLHVGNPTAGWWGEGDEKVFIDGESFPSTFGTGTEDYYGYAWGSPAKFTRPYHAQPRCDGPGSFGHTSVARYHLIDAIPFARSIRFFIELWHWGEYTVDYDRTVYWYGKPRQTGPARIQMKQLPPRNLNEPIGVPGAIEGEKLKSRVTGGTVTMQEGIGEASAGRHLWWTWMNVGDKLTVELPVDQAGVYELIANFICAHDYGIHKITVNATPLPEPFDFYAPNITARKVTLGTFNLNSGVNRIEFECLGKNRAATDGRMLGLDYFLLKKK